MRFDLTDLSHVCHGASGIEIRKDGCLPGPGENVGTLRHEVHAAKDNIFAACACGLLRQFVGVTAKIGEADYLVTLVMVPKNDDIAPKFLSGRTNAVIHGVIGENQIIFQTANLC